MNEGEVELKTTVASAPKARLKESGQSFRFPISIAIIISILLAVLSVPTASMSADLEKPELLRASGSWSSSSNVFGYEGLYSIDFAYKNFGSSGDKACFSFENPTNAKIKATADGMAFGSKASCLGSAFYPRTGNFKIVLRPRSGDYSDWKVGLYKVSVTIESPTTKNTQPLVFYFKFKSFKYPCEYPCGNPNSQFVSKQSSEQQQELSFFLDQVYIPKNWYLDVDGRNLCSEAIAPDSRSVSGYCPTDLSDYKNGNHVARIRLKLYNNKIVTFIDGIKFSSKLSEKPMPILGQSRYVEGKYEGQFSALNEQEASPQFAVKKATCVIDGLESYSFNAEIGNSSEFTCNLYGHSFKQGKHTIKMVLTTSNNQKVSRVYEEISTLASRPLPILSNLTYEENGSTGQISVSASSSLDSASCQKLVFATGGRVVPGLVIEDSLTGNYVLNVQAGDIKNGSAELSAKCTTNDKREFAISKSISINLTHLVPQIAWTPMPEQTIGYGTGGLVPASGKIVMFGGSLPKYVKMRSWQYRRNWSSWKKVAVKSNGSFSARFYAESSLKVQIVVDPKGVTPGVSSENVYDVIGSVYISGPTRVYAGSVFTRKIEVEPKFVSSVTCTEYLHRFNSVGELIDEQEKDPVVIKLKNGIGYIREFITFGRTRSIISCDINSSHIGGNGEHETSSR